MRPAAQVPSQESSGHFTAPRKCHTPQVTRPDLPTQVWVPLGSHGQHSGRHEGCCGHRPQLTSLSSPRGSSRQTPARTHPGEMPGGPAQATLSSGHPGQRSPHAEPLHLQPTRGPQRNWPRKSILRCGAPICAQVAKLEGEPSVPLAKVIQAAGKVF